MKLIDDKGNLFGKINIIDLLILILIVYISSSFFIKKSYLKKLEHSAQRSDIDKAVTSVIVVSQEAENKEVRSNLEQISLIIKFPGYSEWLANAIAVGDKKEDDPGVEIKEIISVRPVYLITNSVVSEHPELKSIIVKISLRVSREGNRVYYNNVPLKIGGQFLFKTDKYDINGEILEIQK
ncbi:MAG: DUF4330 family protein [Candidatus Omnitrophota bacterium]|jgi:hypothetical protein|nr:MAG: DUF4330 family protein [Candidatus Omnitrophota bacterium]